MRTYLLQGRPIVTLNAINNRCSKWQCITIPSECPHGITNDTDEDVIILWNYVSLKDKVIITWKLNINSWIIWRWILTLTTTGFGWKMSWLELYLKIIDYQVCIKFLLIKKQSVSKTLYLKHWINADRKMNKILVFTLILLINFTSRTTGADDIYDDPSSGYI